MSARESEPRVVRVLLNDVVVRCSADQAERCGYKVVEGSAPLQVTQEQVVQAPSVPAEDPDPQPEGDDTPERPKASVVRSWARENTELQVPAKGRVPEAVYEAYEQAH